MLSYTHKRTCGHCGHDGFVWENVTLVLPGYPDRILTRRACTICHKPSSYGENDVLAAYDEHNEPITGVETP